MSKIIEPTQIIAESLAVNGHSIGIGEATKAFNSSLGSTLTCNFKVNTRTQKQLEEYLGETVHCTNTTRATSDHNVLIIARKFARDSVEKLCHPNQTSERSLYIGATARELSAYGKNPANHFLLNNKEDKDNARNLSTISNIFTKIIAEKNLPILQSDSPGSVEMSYRLDTLLKIIEKISPETGLARTHTETPNIRYSILHFQDSLYNMTEKEFLNYFDKTGAYEAHAVMFYPNKFIDSTVPDSKLYNYYESNIFSDHVEFLKLYLGPITAFVASQIPGDLVEDFTYHLLSTLLHFTSSNIVSWLRGLSDLEHPFLRLFGLATDYNKYNILLGPFILKFKKFLLDLTETVKITWKNGFQNGYYHRAQPWKSWASKGRIYGESFCVDREIVTRFGEMYHVKYTISDGSDIMIHELQVPEQFRGIKILNFLKSWNPLTSAFHSEKHYDIVYRSEFYEALQWALGEDVGSLDLDIVITAVNRLKAGLSINSTELVPSWNLTNEEVLSFSIAVLLETYKLKGVASNVLNDKEFLVSYKYNIKEFLVNLGLGIANLSLVGIPGFFLNIYYWMVENKHNVLLVDDSYATSPVLELPKKIKNPINNLKNSINPENPKPSTDHLSKNFLKDPTMKFTFKKKNDTLDNKCEFCKLASQDKFGKQRFHCNQPTSSIQKLKIKQKDMGKFYEKVLKARADHETMNATATVKSIGLLKTFLKTRLTEDLVVDVVVHCLDGGPGSGKSVVCREMAHLREEMGFSVAILSPFSELLEDYSNVTLLDGTKRDDFNFKTMWKASELKNIQVVFVEEMGAFDIEVLIAFLAMNGTREVFIVGDEKQTILQNSEGFSICRQDSPIQKSLMTSHSLVYNFRNNPLVVKILNKVYGYKMISFREDYQNFSFFDKKTYETYLKEHNALMATSTDIKPIEEISFSDTSIRIFGVTASEKHTVRSKQGKSYQKVAIALKEKDKDLLNVHGMLNVAISRSRGEVIFVNPESADDPIMNTVKATLGITTQEEIQALVDTPWPEFKEVITTNFVDPKNFYIQDVLLNTEDGKVLDVVDEDPDIILSNRIFGKDRTVILSLDKIDVLKHCALDALLDLAEKLKIEKKKLKLMYYNFLNLLYEKTPIEKLKGKNALTLEQLMDFIEIHELPIVLVNKIKNTIKYKINKKIKTQISINLAEQDSNHKDILRASSFILFLYISNNHVYSSSELTESERNHLKFPDIKFSFDTEIIKNVNLEIHSTGNAKFKIYSEKDLEKKTLNLSTLDTVTSEKSGYFFLFELLTIDIRDKTFVLVPESLKLHDIFVKNATVGHLVKERNRQIVKTIITKQPEPKKNFSDSIHPINVPSSLILKDSYVPDTLKVQPIKANPIKFGKDNHKLFKVLDPSPRFPLIKKYDNMNVYSGVSSLNKTFKQGSRLIRDGFLFQRTKNGKIKKDMTVFGKRSFTPGYGNIFNGDAVETLAAGQRYLTKKKNKPFSLEGLQFARKLTRDFYYKNIKQDFKTDRLLANTVLHKAFSDMRQRNYFNRGEKELISAKSRKLTISFHNRKIFKPIKGNKLNLFKTGQGIAQTPAWFNYEHCPTMRLINTKFHDSLQDHFNYDNLESVRIFRQKLTRKINALPEFCKTAITDAEEFDANQNWFTVELEKETRRLQGVSEKFLESYYRCRDVNTFKCFGKFSGKTNGEKGSGFLDTLLGNTNTSAVLSDNIITGVGPKVTAAKGDDFAKIQCGLVFNADLQSELLAFTNLRFNYKISDAGEFCGDTIGRSGCYPSITRMCLKALETKSIKYKGGFSENQISFRDKLQDIQECGLMATIAANMQAEDRSFNQVLTALGCFVSICHINETQWKKSTQFYYPTRYQLPGADGLKLPFIDRKKPNPLAL